MKKLFKEIAMFITEKELKKMIEIIFSKDQSLFYGNPTKEQVEIMKNSSVLKKALRLGVLDDFLNRERKKINEKDVWNVLKATEKVNQTELGYLRACEENHYAVFSSHLRSLGLDFYTTETVKKMVDPYQGILFYTKYYLNEPRPWVRAYDFGIPLFPLITTDASSPSDPSGHAFDCAVIAHIVSKNHPELREQIWNIAHSISYTRISAGLHYLQDYVSALDLVDCLVECNLI